jgi:hypothetical protein
MNVDPTTGYQENQVKDEIQNDFELDISTIEPELSTTETALDKKTTRHSSKIGSLRPDISMPNSIVRKSVLAAAPASRAKELPASAATVRESFFYKPDILNIESISEGENQQLPTIAYDRCIYFSYYTDLKGKAMYHQIFLMQMQINVSLK